MRPPGKQPSAEVVERKRLAKEEAEIVAGIRASMARARGNKNRTATSNTFRYVLWFLVALWLVSYLPRFYELLVAPLIDADFSAGAIRQFIALIVFFAVFTLAAIVYDKTPVKHLSFRRKAFVNLLLCVGGLVLLSSFFLLNLAYDFAAVFVICGGMLILWFARRCAKAKP